MRKYVDVTSTEYEYATPALYYGDSNVKIGEPFSITCIIPISSPIHWLKDDEPITRHNLRHGRDEHEYILSESAIEGEKHKIEAHITVRHALKVHEGKYRCNGMHRNYHLLRVHRPLLEPKLQTKSPFIILSGESNSQSNNNGKVWSPNEPTESISIYETIQDLTPSSAIDDIFTRTWDPPQTPVHTAQYNTPAIVTATAPQQKPHHHHNHHTHKQQHQEMERERNKFLYINTSNNNFNMGHAYESSSSDSHESLINLEYIPAPTTTTTTSQHHHHQHPHQVTQMPNFPAPRTTASITTGMFPTLQQQHNPFTITQQSPIDQQQQHMSTIAYFPTVTHTPQKIFRQQQQQQQQYNTPILMSTHASTPFLYTNQHSSTAAILQPKGNLTPALHNKGERHLT